MGKVDDMQEQMYDLSREIRSLKTSWNKMLKTKNSVTEMKNAFWYH